VQGGRSRWSFVSSGRSRKGLQASSMMRTAPGNHMCGVFGEVGGSIDRSARANFMIRANRALQHRGPDGDGAWEDPHCALGHRRLAIIDLSNRASQPMVAASGRTVVAFNGEIYNHVELRPRYQPGAGWRSRSDTEVLLEALDQRGVEALADMVGMFAVAAWRPEHRELWLIRDRLGKKPLYYAITRDGALRFASEVGPLFVDDRVLTDTTLDRLAEYLQHGYVNAPRTGFRFVHAVPPGCWLRARIEGATVRTVVEPYWEPPRTVHAWKGSHAEWLEQFESILKSAVAIRLRSDVQLGTFLSGGVDSSVVSHVAANTLGSNLRTFTVDFCESEFSEGAYAREVARSIGSTHEELMVRSDAVGSLDDLVGVYGDLHGDSSAIPTLALCKAARSRITVALSGDGGDELLGGYQRYYRTLTSASLAARTPRIARSLIRRLGGRLPLWVKGAASLRRFEPDAAAQYSSQMCSYGPGWPEVLVAPGSDRWPDSIAEALAGPAGGSPLQRLMSCDLRTFLPGDILVKVDRASMAYGLEVRSPFLDHRLFEHVALARPAWLTRGGETKQPLRDLFSRRLPPAVFARRKMGFGVPLTPWLRNELRDFAAGALLGSGSSLAPIVCREPVLRLIQRHARGVRDESQRLWHLLVLEAWLKHWRANIRDT
jgi:asparagine synthase (glutamine-hydrolysing)